MANRFIEFGGKCVELIGVCLLQLVSFLVRLRNYQPHVITVGFSGGFPVAVVTTLLVYRGRISGTCSYTSSTVVGTTSGKAQLHCSNSGEIFVANLV
jgi:hypothetical protein